MLAWAGVELFFSTVAGVGFHFGFVVGTVLVIQRFFFLLNEECFHSVKVSSALPPTSPLGRLGVHKESGGAHNRKTDPNDTVDVPDHIVSSLAYTFGGREGRRDLCTFNI